MPTLTELLFSIADLFRNLDLEPLVAAAFIVVMVALLARRVKRAVLADPDDPYTGYSAEERQHAEREDYLDGIEETDPDEFHRRVEEDPAFAALVEESETWWRAGRQQVFGDGAPD